LNPRRYLAAGPLLAVGIIVLAIVPWWSFRDHSHWDKVEWIPFTSPVFRWRDVVANVLLFVPLGVVVARRSAPQRRVVNAAAIGAALSILAELAQVYSHSRFPTATDVVANVLGATLAAMMVASPATNHRN
jgi:glycopeptide antibiotics resistance protein